MSNEQLTQGAVAETKSGASFDQLRALVQKTFAERMEAYGPGLFVTKSKGLSTVYRKAFPEEQQQHHNCSSCRTFFERFGHMVFVTPEGELVSALWDPENTPEEYKASVTAIHNLVLRSGISEIQVVEHDTWGTGETDGWTHYQVQSLPKYVAPFHLIGTIRGKANTSFDLLLKATQRYTPEIVGAAINQLKSAGKAMERWLPQLEWLYGFVKGLDGKNVGQIRNLVRREVAMVAPSFAEITNNVEGNILLDGIADGRTPEAVLRTFILRVDPEFYRQKEAPPTEGNVQVAQKLFAELGLGAGDMERRLASLDEIRQTVWTPPAAPEAPAKEVPLFGDLVTKQATEKPQVAQTVADGGRMTWEKFKEKILPTALELKTFALIAEKYVFFSAPKNPDAGRLWFYDLADNRNPYAWHTTNDPQPCRHLGLYVDQLLDVVGITTPPAVWTGGERGKKYDLDILLVKGLRDPRESCGLALFAELLRPELTVAERVIQAYSLKGNMDTTTLDQAVGLSTAVPRRVQVRTEFGLTNYVIDRLE
jgi:hypothetical protein